MAAANKSTGLQIALVFTVMSMIIAFVVAFLQYRAAADAEAKLARSRKAERRLRTSCKPRPPTICRACGSFWVTPTPTRSASPTPRVRTR